MRVLVWIVAPVVLIFGLALVMLWAPLPQPFPPAWSGGRNQMAAVVTGILCAVCIVALTVRVVRDVRRAGRFLGDFLHSAGLASEGYRMIGRRYYGALDGREVEVTFLPRVRVQPAQVDVIVGARSAVRMAIGRKRPLLDCRDCARLDTPGAGWEEVQVYAREEEGVRRLLSAPSVGGAMERVVSSQEGAGFWEIYIQPERIWLRMRPYRLTEEQFRERFAAFLGLAEIVESEGQGVNAES